MKYFFFDRCIAPRLARMLDAYDAENHIYHQDDDRRFDDKIKDTDLIRTLAKDVRKPVFLTADTSMSRMHAERRALAESHLTVVFFRRTFHNLDFHTQAVKLLKIWPEIVHETSRCRHPTAFEITPAATKVQQLRATKDL